MALHLRLPAKIAPGKTLKLIGGLILGMAVYAAVFWIVMGLVIPSR